MPDPAPVPAHPAPPGPPPDPSVDITLNNLSDGDSIECPFTVTGEARSRDGSDIASVSRQHGIGPIAPVGQDPPYDHLHASPWFFHFDITAFQCPDVDQEYTLTMRATKDGETYYLTVTFTRIA